MPATTRRGLWDLFEASSLLAALLLLEPSGGGVEREGEISFFCPVCTFVVPGEVKWSLEEGKWKRGRIHRHTRIHARVHRHVRRWDEDVSRGLVLGPRSLLGRNIW